MVDLHKKGFEDFYLSDEMLRALKDVGYVTPTPVQTSTIQLGMAGIDLIVQSQTGTGKTAAFGIPILEMVDPRPGRIEGLVLAPTRELAKQVAEEFERLGAHKGIRVATIYGGASYDRQYEDLAEANIVCATPGRLLDILNRGNLSLEHLRVLCLDEADEMLSMGFAEDLNAILKYLPEERQSLLFSATITAEIKALASNMLYYPEFVTLSGAHVAAADVEHSYISVRGVSRVRDMLAILEFEQPENAIIFANTKDDTFTLSKYLKRHGMRADVLNGDLPQKERERTLAALRDNKIDFLVATDVAARGIDISDLSHVINYTLPDSAEVYIHRTGRTGRAGKKGKALSLVSPREMGNLINIKKLYKFPMTQRPLPSARDIMEARQKSCVQAMVNKIDGMDGLAYGAQLGVAESLVGKEDPERLRFIAKLLAVAENASAGASKPAQRPAPAPAHLEADVATHDVDVVDDQTRDRAVAEVSARSVHTDIEDTDVPLEQGRRRRRRRRGESDVEAPTSTTERAERPERSERAERPERSERAERPERSERVERPERSERAERPERSERAERPERSERAERPERSERSEERPARSDSEARPERSRRGRRRSENRDQAPAPAANEPTKSAPSSDRPARSEGPSSDRNGRRGGRSRDRRPDRRERTEEPVVAPKPTRHWSKMWINVGKNRVDSPSGVVDILCELAGMDPEDFGQVSLESTFSYLDVREDYFYDILQAINQQEYNGFTIAAEAARK